MKRKQRIQVELSISQDPFKVMEKVKSINGILKIAVINFSAISIFYNPQQIAETDIRRYCQ